MGNLKSLHTYPAFQYALINIIKLNFNDFVKWNVQTMIYSIDHWELSCIGEENRALRSHNMSSVVWITRNMLKKREWRFWISSQYYCSVKSVDTVRFICKESFLNAMQIYGFFSFIFFTFGYELTKEVEWYFFIWKFEISFSKVCNAHCTP